MTPGPTGLPEVDRLADLESPTLADYIGAVSQYVRRASTLKSGAKKSGQIRTSNALGRALLGELRARLPHLQASAGESRVAGALRTVQADVSEMHRLDGLRLAIELKPVLLAVGRALWNRFGDLRTFAVNLHLKFPFAVVGGVMAIPTYEADGDRKKDTTHLIARLVSRLERGGGRKNEGDAPHLLEGIGVAVFDPETATLSPDLPPADSLLCWDRFVDSVAAAYESRFEAD